MNAEAVLAFSTQFALVVLSLALLTTVLRILRGPTLPDRVLGLDMLVAIAIGFIAVMAIRTGFNLYIDIAIALGLVGFLATVAFARFILARGLSSERAQVLSRDEPQSAGRRKTKARRKSGRTR